MQLAGINYLNLTIPGGTVRQNLLEPCRAVLWPRRMTKRSPFRSFKTSLETIRLAVMLYFQLKV